MVISVMMGRIRYKLINLDVDVSTNKHCTLGFQISWSNNISICINLVLLKLSHLLTADNICIMSGIRVL